MRNMGRVLIKEIGRVITGNTPNKNNSEFYSSKDIGFIKPDIISGEKITYIKTTNEFISEQARSKARIVKDNAVLITCIGIVGKVCIVNNGEYAFNQQINAIIPNGRVSAEYLAYCLLYNRKKLNHIANAPVVPIINKTQFENFQINIIDSREEQNQIVKVLNRIGNVIKVGNKQISRLDDLIKSRFVEMFGTLQGNQYGYDIVMLEDVCSMIKDGTHQTPTYTENKEEGYKFLSSKDVMTQKIDWSDIRYIPADLHEKLYATIKPQKNDILMSKNGVNYGIAAVNDTDEIFDIYVSLALLRPSKDIHPVYLRCVINNPDTKRQFDGSIKGIGVPNLHLGEIKKTKILLPSLALQNQFADFVAQIDKLKFIRQKSLEKTQLLFDSLMQKYFG